MAVLIKDSNNKILGVLEAKNKIGGTFSNDDEVLLIMLASFVALVLQNTYTFEKFVWH